VALTISSPPAIEPVTLAEAKEHLGVVHDEHNEMIATAIKASREYFESTNNRAYITQTWTWKLETFPENPGILYVPRPPLSSVTSIAYVDTAGDAQTWSADSYDVDTDSEPRRIEPAYGESWPSVRGDLNGITVTFVAGYGTAVTDVPAKARALIMQLVAAQYESPDGVSGQRLTESPVLERLEWADNMQGVA
jgi:uncharacterized phiE125 gp8 family phage protein